jgi:predicted RNA methylase
VEETQGALDQWLTPATVAEAFLHWCRIGDDDRVLEPAAGEGALVVLGHPRVLAFEIDPERAAELRYWRPEATVICTNFLALPPPAKHIADVCVQNPPYGNAGEGTFIDRALHWAPRVCALVRTSALHGGERFEVCWSRVALTRITYFKNRPKFLGPRGVSTKFTPAYDYVALEAVRRVSDEPERPEVTWVSWR